MIQITETKRTIILIILLLIGIATIVWLQTGYESDLLKVLE